MDLDWIRTGLKRPGKTQRGLAAALGVDPSQVNRLLKGDRRLRADEVEKIKRYLDIPVIESSSAIEKVPGAAMLDPGNWGRDMPVRGVAAAGPDGAFALENGTIDYVKRPPRLIGIPDAYALYVQGSSMSPWREEGQVVYVHPYQPCQVEDYVVIQVQDGEHHPTTAYIKRLVRRSATDIVLLQFNPRRELRFPAKRVLTLHRIIDWSELLGL